MNDGMMLNCGDDNMRMPSPRNVSCQTLDGHVIGLGATRGEDDFGRCMRTQSTRDAGTGVT